MKKLLLMVSLLVFSACASIQSFVLFDLRKDELGTVQGAYRLDDEAYKKTISRWPHLSVEGIQRRSLIYTLSKEFNTDHWTFLGEKESLKTELKIINQLLSRENIQKRKAYLK